MYRRAGKTMYDKLSIVPKFSIAPASTSRGTPENNRPRDVDNGRKRSEIFPSLIVMLQNMTEYDREKREGKKKGGGIMLQNMTEERKGEEDERWEERM